MAKKRVAVLFGGKSEEYEVSIMSCTSVLRQMDYDQYVVYVFGVSKNGQWRYVETVPKTDQAGLMDAFDSGRVMPLWEVAQFFEQHVDVVLPVTHGPYGEDGKLQGFFEIIGMPYVGANVSASVLCMDKAFMRTVLKANGIPMADYVVIHQTDDLLACVKACAQRLKYPLFVKPANLGSSVGISKANGDIELFEAIQLAFQYDKKVVIEQGVQCRELECGILGNGPYEVSVVGEIIASHEFYDYNAKYFDGGKSQMIVPADIPEKHKKDIQDQCHKIAKILGVQGMARIDFFLDTEKDILLFNEVNTIPGFTQFSMYPSLFAESGLSYSGLIDQLIRLALEREA